MDGSTYGWPFLGLKCGCEPTASQSSSNAKNHSKTHIFATKFELSLKALQAQLEFLGGNVSFFALLDD